MQLRRLEPRTAPITKEEKIMNTVQRYNYQKDSNDPLQKHIDNINRAIKHFGNQLLHSFGQNAIDSYVITLVKTRDGRRALLDISDVYKAKAALEKDIIKEVSADIRQMAKQIQRNI